jgi:hypothetical protein
MNQRGGSNPPQHGEIPADLHFLFDETIEIWFKVEF